MSKVTSMRPVAPQLGVAQSQVGHRDEAALETQGSGSVIPKYPNHGLYPKITGIWVAVKELN